MTKRERYTSTRNRLAVSALFLLCFLGVKAQTNYSGVYYIANKVWNGDYSGSTYWYNNLTPAERWYLVPAADPQQDNYEDAYYSDDAYATPGDPTTPFLTTYQTNRDNNSIWIVKKTGDKYYIIHALTGKYVKYEPPISSKPNRRSMHLEAVEGDAPGNVFKFKITPKTEHGISGYNMNPTLSNGNLVSGFMNPASDNWPSYHALEHTTEHTWVRGLVGYYNQQGGGSLWPWENEAKDALTPTINDLNPANNTVTITPGFVPVNCQLVYTTDGNDPSPSHGTPYVDPISVTETMTIKAAVIGYGMVLSNVNEKLVVPTLAKPVFTYDCNNGKVSIECTNNASASIFYNMTTDGSEPSDPTNESTPYSGPLTLNNACRIKAVAFYLVAYSDIASLNYSPDYGTVPTISSDDCSADNPQCNIMTVDGLADLSYWYYITTVNGNDNPDVAPDPNEVAYTEFTLGSEVILHDLTEGNNGYCTVHFYAVMCGSRLPVSSTVHQLKTSGKPSLTPPSGSNPVLVIDGGVYDDKAAITIDMGTPEDPSDDITEEVDIVYDGTAEYTIPSEASGTLTVTFKHGNWLTSCEATYEIPAAPAAPTWSQSCDNKLSLSTLSPMATIHYILNGEVGDQVTLSSPTYTEGCLYNIAEGTIVRAKAFEGFRASEEMLADPVDPSSGYYVHHQTHVAAPTFFVNGTEVTIRCATSGASIYYTVSTNNNNNEEEPIADPADPDTSDPTQLYTTEYTLTGITKIKAIAVKDGMENSCQILVTTREGYSITNVTELNVISGDQNKRSKYWFIENDFNASGYNGPVDFTGVLVGNYHTISGLTKPLFSETSNNAVVRDLNLKVNIPNTTSGNVGAIACTAKDNTRIYNCGILPITADGSSTSQVGGTGKVGGLVGELKNNARVINCFSYADITSGTHRGGIVGMNDVTTASTQTSVNTMIMNCMFYGDISTSGSPTQIAPIYGGKKISNSGASSTKGLNNFNYFRFNSPYVSSGATLTYNCALGAKDRNLERFEFYRLILNSNRELASWYIKSTVTGASERVGHWVLDKSVAPYPILKTGEGVYPSIINPDAAHAIPIDPDNEHRNEGRKLGELTVKITAAIGWTNKPTGAGLKDDSYATTGLTINITDKDEANYNFNYKKIQLPYYNDVGTNNYTDNKVVTGWKITAFEGGTPGTFSTENFDYPCYNFVDRACTNKDLYDGDGTDGSDRVFNQGAYYEVPDGVTKITIEPYWANCVYLSDAKYDVTYNGMTACPVSTMGDRPITFNGEQAVYNNIATALSNLTAGTTVYDAAVVLVGNYHHFFNETSLNPTDSGKPLTIMSADMDNDNEPDNSFFYQHYDRRDVKPLRFDFINIPGIGMAQKEDGKENDPQPGIFHATGWFEITNTVLIHFGQFEFADKTNNAIKPIILHGGIYEQYVSTNNGNATYQYMFVGGNAWFKEFNVGCHTRDGAGKTPKHPVSVAGGEYEKFYLSGRNKPEQTQDAENAECYIDGGKFGEVAGAGMQQIVGNVTWLINGADIQSFFGGGINYDKPITGTITTTIRNSWVDEFCGGPKFGNMSSGMAVTTEAIDCHFGKFFGAGYGGTAYNRKGLVDESQSNNYDDKWNTWVNDHYKRAYNSTYHGVSTSYEYEYFFYSGGRDAKKVGRFYVNFASLSLASTQDVTSTLMGCTIGDFYGGGKYGSVNGDVVSTLTDCTVTGDAFGSGYSAAVPTVEVTNRENSSGTVGFETKPYYDNTANVFNDDKVSPPVPTVTYTWKHANSVTTGNEFDEEGGHFILTTENLDNLGAVLGNATLTINGNTVVKGDVYGGGAKSSSNTNNGTCTVNINGGTYGVVENNVVTGGNIYGGGMGDLASLATPEDPNHSDLPVTEGIVEVNIGNALQEANNVVIHGSVYGCNNVNGSPTDDVTVHIYKTKHNSSNVVTGSGYAISQVFGGGNQAHYQPAVANKTATVHVHNCDNTIEYVYGGGNAANVGTLDADPDEEGNQPITANTSVIIDGGRIEWVFGGGNGYSETNNHNDPSAPNYNPGANIYGNTSVTYHAGHITYLFGGSNEWGSVSGEKNMSLFNDGACSVPENRIVELYGGNNKAPITGGAGTTLTMPCTSNPCPIDYVFGGSREANISGDVTLTIEGGNYNNVFGGNNISGEIDGNVTLNLYGGTINNAFGGNKGGGSITGNITVNVEDQCGDCPLQVNNIFGAGDLAEYTAPGASSGGRPDVREFNPIVHVKNICGTNTITGNVYGGGKGNPDDDSQEPGMVTGNPKVIIGDTDHETYRAAISGNVYGGGNAAKVVGNTSVLVQKDNSVVNYYTFGGGNLADVTGSTTVNIEGGTVYSVYGGGALASTGPTTVNILAGTIQYGDVYGGCLGGPYNEIIYSPAVNGTTTVNIGSSTLDPITGLYTGSATFTTSSVYGGNDAYGSPTGNATVNVYRTAHTTTNTYTYIENDGVNGEPTYAIAGVFGGGNSADFEGPNTYVNIYGCDNTIERVFGGSNAASAETVNTMIQGGRIGQVFGGGNGYISSSDVADIHGDVNLDIHGGTIQEVYGGGNEVGTISGTISLNVNKTSDCDMIIREVYSGGNQAANAAGNITIGCTGDLVSGENGHAAHPENIGVTLEGIGTVYGGANQADIGAAGEGNESNIVLNINDGIVANVFGGNNNSGTIYGTITVNIEQTGSCDWYVGNVFGGGNLAVYDDNPKVFIKNGTVSGNVYGGGNGDPHDNTQTKGSTGVPTVTVGDLTNDGYQAIVLGDVYGGGNAAKVTGENVADTIYVQKCNTQIKYVYGGGNAAEVPATFVKVMGGTIDTIFGGGHGSLAPSIAADVTGNDTISITGGTIKKVFAGSNLNGSIGGKMALKINKDSDGCDMKIGEVYGGGNQADGKASTITIGCTGSLVSGENGHAAHPENIGVTLEGIGTVYGGANQAGISNDIVLNINSGIVNNVYGGNNTSGNISGSIQVNINKTGDACGWYVGNVFGGGNQAAYNDTPDVNIQNGTVSGSVYGGGNEAGVGGGDVAMTGGTVLGGIYGGCNTSGVVDGDITVNITNGTIGTDATHRANVHGGGFGDGTSTTGNVTVNFGGTPNDFTSNTEHNVNLKIFGDIYGGSAFGSVNADGDNTTTVNILNGTLVSYVDNGGSFPVYYGGNVFGGGLGEAGADNADKGKVNGVVKVNIGKGTLNGGYSTETLGEAIIQGNVYGCNNTNGSPQQNVTVNIYHTAHTADDSATYVGTPPSVLKYALQNVFGGGNQADFRVTEMKTTVNIYGCDNTIGRTFSGGNAAATNTVSTMIQGGRINEAFAGGNGEVSEANIYGNAILAIHGGDIGMTFAGSNQNGQITGSSTVTIDDEGCGGVQVNEHFCGNNFSDYYGDIVQVIECPGMHVKNLYGGCKQAKVLKYPSKDYIIANQSTLPETLITLFHEHEDEWNENYAGKGGNIHLTVTGGVYENIYGGSQGKIDPANSENNISADIDGHILLEIHGGTVTNAVYGGSHILGRVGGTITVNVEDKNTADACPLVLSVADIYGGGNMADYTTPTVSGHDEAHDFPHVNIKNATVKNVFGGAFEAEVTGNPQIKIKKGAKVLGNVYGGGNMGVVNGNPRVIVNGKDESDNPTGNDVLYPGYTLPDLPEEL